MRGDLQRDTACAALLGHDAGGDKLEGVDLSFDVSIIGKSGEVVNTFSEKPSSTSLPDLLKQYHRLGLSVIPASNDKRPLIPWKPFTERQPTENELHSWQTKYPGANWGAVTGKHLAALDFDTRSEPNSYHLPPTPVNVTPRGYHFIYRRNGEHLRPCRLSKACELKTGATFIMLPPSTVKGVRYHWLCDLVPLSIDEFAPLPADIIERANRLSRHANNTPFSDTQTGGVPSRNIPTGYPPTPQGVSESVSGDVLAFTDADPRIVRAAAVRCGIPEARAYGDGLGRTFCCVIPGHVEGHASASLFRTADGKVLYRDWHWQARLEPETDPDGWARYEWFTLSEVFASRMYGQAVKLSPSEQAVWHLRLLYETGALEPAEVVLPALEAGAPASVRRVYEGFRLLLGLRWRHTPGDPTAFTRRFAGAWCGVGTRQAGAAIQRLIGSGCIRVVGRHNGAGRSCALFLPGDDRRED